MQNLRGGCARRRLTTNKTQYYFPDEIIINILSRLPAKDVLGCRYVCKKWKDLTSNRYFLETHLKHSIPMILADDRRIRSDENFLLDKWWETDRKRSVIQRISCEYYIVFSHSGLIVSQQVISNVCFGNFMVFNPMNGEKVRITLSDEISWSDLYGLFFHPVLKDNCTLWRLSPKGWGEYEKVRYKFLNMGSNPCWHEIKNQNSSKPLSKCPRIWFVAPVSIESYVYWVIDARQDGKHHNYIYNTASWLQFDIIEFDIINEELRMMPCLVRVVMKRLNCNINLLNIEGRLSLVEMSQGTNFVDINIWTLKNRAEESWQCYKYSIRSNVYSRMFGFKVGRLKAISVANGELAIQSHRTLFVYNLKRASIRILGKKKQSHDVAYLSHLMSFASLRNCKSNICMDERGEVDEGEKKSAGFQ